MEPQRTYIDDTTRVELVLEENTQFHGYTAADLWCVRTLSRAESDDYEIDGVLQKVWNAHQSEYYLDVPDQRVMAAYAYVERCKQPFQPSRYAMSLDAIGLTRA